MDFQGFEGIPMRHRRVMTRHDMSCRVNSTRGVVAVQPELRRRASKPLPPGACGSRRQPESPILVDGRSSCLEDPVGTTDHNQTL